MTLDECYSSFGGSYTEVKGRLQMDKLVEKFMLKFLDDKTMAELCSACDNNDHELAFRSAHTLKGVSANLSFSRLTSSASALTEQLRSGTDPADPVLLNAVKDDYNQVVEAIRLYQAQKA